MAEPDLVELARLREAMTLIELFYCMEGKDATWRAAHMNSVARDAQEPGKSLSYAKRFFPRHFRSKGA